MTTTKTVLAEIAKKHLWIDTLAERKRDALDFHEVGVVAVRKALQAAYDAGRADATAATAANAPADVATDAAGHAAAGTDVAGSDTDALFALLRDNLSPEAVTSIVAHVQGASTNDPMADQQVRWFAERLVRLLGGNAAFAQHMEELGL